jgi:hypothetical protein
MADIKAFQPKPAVVAVEDAAASMHIFLGGLLQLLVDRGVIEAADLVSLLEDIESGVANQVAPNGPGRPELLDAVRVLGRRYRRAMAVT